MLYFTFPVTQRIFSQKKEKWQSTWLNENLKDFHTANQTTSSTHDFAQATRLHGQKKQNNLTIQQFNRLFKKKWRSICAFLFLLASLFLSTPTISAQCEADQIPVTITMQVGEFGNDTQWTLTDDDTGEIYGSRGPYGDFNTFIDTVCVNEGANVTFTLTCCLNNDGAFEVAMLGFVVASGNTFQFEQPYSFVAVPPAAIDLTVLSIDFKNHELSMPQTVGGTIRNLGSEIIHTLDLHWQLNDDTPFTHTLTDLNIEPFNDYAFIHSDIWNAEVGEYELKVWASNINGLADEVPSNDLHTKNISISKALSERVVLLENYVNASCTACEFADPHFDGLVFGSPGRMAPISFHAPFSGLDPMFLDNPDDVLGRVAFTGVLGAPTAYVEGGLYNGFTAQLETVHLNEFKARPAVMSFGLNEHLLTGATGEADVAYIEVVLEALVNIPSENLRLQVVMTEHLVHYESPPGTTGLQDFYFVMRKMLPDFEGTAIPPQSIGMNNRYHLTYEIPDFVAADQLRTLVFVEDTVTKEIVQAFAPDGITGSNRTMNTIWLGGNTGYLEVKREMVTCFGGQDGTVSIEAHGMYPPFLYLWGDGSAEEQRSNLGAGVYPITIFDSNANEATFIIELPEATGMITETTTLPETDGAANGSATVSIVEGTPPFTYLWSDGQTTATATNLATGIYTVMITDAFGCTQTVGASVESVTGIATNEVPAFTTYPNPTTTQIQIQFSPIPPLQKASLQCYNLLGRQVAIFPLSVGQQQVTVGTSSWRSGIYFVVLEIDGTIVGKEKLVVIE